MAQSEFQGELPPHVLIFPVPLQGHVNSMLKLAELLCLAGFHVTMLLSDFCLRRLRRHANLESIFSTYPSFHVVTIPDGLPDDNPRVGVEAVELVMSLLRIGESEFRKLLQTTDLLRDGGSRRPVSLLILDGVFNFVIPVAEEMGIPYVHFRTISACSFWAYFCYKQVIEAGEVPIRGENEEKYEFWKNPEMDLPVTSVPGMGGVLRRRDLPSLFRVFNINDKVFQTIGEESRKTALSMGLILNSFEDLEGPVIDEIRKQIPCVYSIGPLHTHLKSRLESENKESSLRSSSFWEEDRTSISWLSSQNPRSVIYVSFGSLTTMTRNELLEFWYGLVNSGHKFLWVIRPDTLLDSDKKTPNPVELDEATKERGRLVEWAPQNEVLAHPAIGAFFTHSGWNSTLESIAAGVPMICWPYFADQTTNSRFVSHVWNLGLDLKDNCDRAMVEKMVREIMENRREELRERACDFAKMAKKAVDEGGTSQANLQKLIDFIKSTSNNADPSTTLLN